jgi:predicted lipoprotein with Yx(FWY)xxD motif
MRLLAALVLPVAALLAPMAAWAQPNDLPIPAATTDKYPPGVTVRRTPAGPVYADARGRTLYGMDMRTLLRWSPDAAQYCQAACQTVWQAQLAPSDAVVNIRFPLGFGGQRTPPDPRYVPNQTAPDWTVIAGPQGPQWVYKGWHMVFVRRGDKPGSTAHDGADSSTWNTLKFVPPVPKVVAPGDVAPRFTGRGYVLTDGAGRTLFTGKCSADCTAWQPFVGGMASAPMGQWNIDTSGDRPQWRYRGKPVFVGHSGDPADLPRGGKAIAP